MAAEPNLSLLYGNLTPESAGPVISALDAEGAAYEVRGGSIFVDDARRDQLRLTLAGQSLPSVGQAGYEILDTSVGIATTNEMFGVAYGRAREGELARTIATIPQVREARVHIAQEPKRMFREASPPTASVGIKSSGGPLPVEIAEAIRNLVSSAVPGLELENVSVIDVEHGSVVSGSNESIGADSNTKAQELKSKALTIVEAVTGVGNAVVEVSVDTISAEQRTVERILDQESAVPVSTIFSERSSSSNSQNGDGVTVGSNLPDGDAAEGGGQSNSQETETNRTENIDYSETETEIIKKPGDIERITVAVMVNGSMEVNNEGLEVFTPRSEEQLAQLTTLIQAAVGFNPQRGDVVTVQSMQLQPTPAPLAASDNWVSSSLFDPASLIKPVLTALVVLALGFFVLRPILSSARAPNLVDDARVIEGSSESSSSDGPGDGFPMALPMMEDMSSSTPSFEELDIPMALPDPGDFQMGGGIANFDEDPVARLKTLIDERQDETVEVLKNWMEQPEETTS